ncbi:hypothetical protein E4T56_gene6659, partial [Termitomyces sp. T112]
MPGRGRATGAGSLRADRMAPFAGWGRGSHPAYHADQSGQSGPFGVLCQFSPERNGPPRPTLADFITRPGVYPAGRLDHDSEGLLLLTDDGRLQARIADPRYKAPKTYLVQVEGEPDEAALEAL